MIEIPIRTDVSWPGHRFSLHSAVSNVSRNVAVSRSGSRIADFSRASSLRGLAEIDLVRTASSGCGGLTEGGGGDQAGSGLLGVPDLEAGTEGVGWASATAGDTGYVRIGGG